MQEALRQSEEQAKLEEEQRKLEEEKRKEKEAFDAEMAKPLPPGWERKVNEEGKIYYIDHITR